MAVQPLLVSLVPRPKVNVGFYPNKTDTSEKPDNGRGGVSCQNAGSIQTSLNAKLWQRKGKEPVLLHSDRGCQFTSYAYQRFLNGHNLVCSISAAGSCADNAAAAGFFGMLKRERVNQRRYLTRAEARSDIFDYVERFHNPKRRRKMERLESEKKLFIKPSVETG